VQLSTINPILKNLSPKEQEELNKELKTAVINGGIDDHDGQGGGWIRLPPKLQDALNKLRGTPGYEDSMRINPMSRALILEEEGLGTEEEKRDNE
jgi:hypothetical protein